MADQDPTFKIPREVIQPIIEAKVSSALIEALGNQDWLVRNCISKVLDQKVKDDGSAQTDSYYQDKSPTFLQWALTSCLKAKIKQVIQEEVEKHRETIAEGLRKELAKKTSPLVKQLIEGMTGAIITASKAQYQLTVEVKENSRY
jgi:hypothetical protein